MGAWRPFFVKERGLADLQTREKTLEREIAPAVERSLPGVEVLAVELLSPSRFCVYIDTPEGVDLELCERVTRLLDDYRRDYGIDVSSPGPERPLRKPEHFARAAGRRVSLRTDAPFDGKTRLRGEVVEAGADVVTVSTATGVIAIPYAAIVRANLMEEVR